MEVLPREIPKRGLGNRAVGPLWSVWSRGKAQVRLKGLQKSLRGNLDKDF